MKKRPLSKLYLYTLLSLGLYQYLWIARTRREMMALVPGVRIPPMGWIGAIFTLNMAAFLLIVFAVISLGVSGDRVRVSETCWKQYVISQTPAEVHPGAEAIGYTPVYTTACRHEIARSDQADRQQKTDGVLLAAGFGILMLDLIAYGRWLGAYGRAVAQVTGGRISASMTVLYLGVFPLGSGVVLMQQVFNQIDTAPAPVRQASAKPMASDYVSDLISDIPQESAALDKRFPVVKAFLTVVAVIVVLALVLGLTGIFLAVH